jgi:hypothetical protein
MLTKDLAGYIFEPRTYPNSPGHPALTLILRHTPTEEHFDPAFVHLHVILTDSIFGPLTVRHPWPRGSEHYRMSAGRVYVEDAKHKRLEFYTLGGMLSIQSEHESTVCRLTSPAPIMEMTLTPCVPELLVEEIEGLIARRRAVWEIAPHEFDVRMAQTDPLRLYLACLITLKEQFDRQPYNTAMSECTWHLKHFLGEEVEIVRGQLNDPLNTIMLEEIL